MKTTITEQEITAIANSEHHDPFEVLGMHEVQWNGKKAIAVRAYFYDEEDSGVYDVKTGKRYPMERFPGTGFFETVFPDRTQAFPYQLDTVDTAGKHSRFDDTYSFWPVLSNDDLSRYNEGNHETIYEKLGCHLITHQGVKGALFAVWAPNAKRVSVVGDFNHWDGRRHPMRLRGMSGIWELFIPGLSEGALYKFEIKSQENHLYVKTDPYAFFCEQRPETSSIIARLDHFSWNDQEWMEKRTHDTPLEQPVSVYEVHLGSWRRGDDGDSTRFLTYRELADTLIPYVKEMGFTHIELLPVAEHPLDASWGYQVTGYYAPTSRHGTPDEFMAFVDACHQERIGVIMDWVPAHFPKDSHSLAYFDGTCLYEHADPRQGEHKDWGTLIFNYGRTEVKNFLIANALFWLDKYHIDGIRVDAVASMLYLDYSKEDGEWVANEFGGHENLEAIAFLKELNEKVYARFPGVMMIAEESTAWPAVTQPTYLGGLGFLFKWNMGWMHDMLGYLAHDPIFRHYHHNLLTFPLMYAFQENFMLVLSHDEVVHGKGSLLNKMPGDTWQKFANLRLFYGFMTGHPGKKLLFMGGEFGQWSEWNCDQSLDWHLLDYESHQGLQRFVRDLNQIYTSEPVLSRDDLRDQGFAWIDCQDSDNSVVSFLRKSDNSEESALVFLCNFTPVPHHGYRIGVPSSGYYQELVNSDAAIYGGSNLGNGGGCLAEAIPWQGYPYSVSVTVPPLGMMILKVDQKTAKSEDVEREVQQELYSC